MESYEDEVVRKSAATKDVKKRFWLKIIGVAFLVFFLGGGVAVVTTYLTLRSAAEDGTQLAQQIKQACEEPGLTDADLAQFCPKADEVVKAAPDQVKSDPVPGPPGPTGPAGESGSNGSNGTNGADAPAPTVTQVKLALSSLCTDAPQVCRSNKSITPAQVSVAVAAYCNSNGQCVGPKGAPGEDGADAPSVTSAQLSAAVANYCSSRNDCQGSTGAQGPAGQDGQNGQNGSDSIVPGPPGVVSIVDNCPPADTGQVISDVNPSYNSDTQTISINCEYKDDLQGGLLPTNP